MKNIILYSLLIISIIMLTACKAEDTNKQITNFEECAAAGNPIMESYPAKCSSNGETFIREVEIIAPEPEIKACTREYMPVCGEVEVQCIKAPCPPIKTTFANICEAENGKATNIVEGACTDEKVNLEGDCLSFDGNWLAEFGECEGMSNTQCEELGGTFNECGSACRNNPEAEMCTMQCIAFCKFE